MPIKQVNALLAMLLLLSSPMGSSSGSEGQAENPAVSTAGFFVSHQGLYHFDATSLKPRWQALTGQNTLEPTLWGDRVLVTGSSGVHAYNQSRGEKLWRYRTKAPAFPASIQENRVYIATQDGTLTVLDIKHGLPLWEIHLQGWIYPPAVADGMLVTGGEGGILWGIDTRTGSIRWQTDIGQELVYRPILLNNRQIAVTTFDGKLHVLDTQGNIRWQQQFDSTAVFPSSDRERLYVHELSGNLHALALTDGQPLWKLSLGHRPVAPVSMIENRLFSVSENGEIRELDPKTGRTLTRQRIQAEPITPVFQQNKQKMLIVQQRGVPIPLVLSNLRYSDPIKGETHE